MRTWAPAMYRNLGEWTEDLEWGFRLNEVKSPKKDALPGNHGYRFIAGFSLLLPYRNLKLIETQVYQSLFFDIWFLEYAWKT